MSLVVGFMVWIDDEPTKGTADSLETAKALALQSVTGKNRVEIKTTYGRVVTWRYNNETKEFEEVA